MVYPVTPVLLTKVLGAPAWVVGLVEEIAESAASLLKVYSGSVSDRQGKRKPITLSGYALSTVTRPLIGAAGAWGQVLFARLLDRVGKGLRTAPRDALIAESTPESQRGRAFGLHRAMDTAGAVIGPFLGYLYLTAYPESYRNLYLIALIPGAIAVGILWLFVHEHGPPRVTDPAAHPGMLRILKGLSPAYRRYLAIVTLFALGNSSDAFVILRSQSMGVRAEQILLAYALFNIVEAALSYRIGMLSDKFGRRPVVALGYAVFAAVYLGFAALDGAAAAWTLFMLYGLYYALTQGVQRALASDYAHPDRRAAELGAFHMLVGLAALPASLAAGLLYTHIGSTAPFFVGACTAIAASRLLAGAADSSNDREEPAVRWNP
jgi:MFS family permease